MLRTLLLTCVFFQVHVYVSSFYFESLHKQSCIGSEWFRCPNNICISYTLKCDGDDDCGDGSDEENCHNHILTNPPHLVCARDEYRCKNNDCIPLIKFCDAMIDCIDRSDEYDDCVKDLKCEDRFRCNDQHCVLKQWVCDGKNDCPDGSDELNCKNKTFTTSDCHNGNDRYLCENQRCIPLDMVCDKTNNCGDGSDEGGQCTSANCTIAHCHQGCKQTPRGPVCTCRQGYTLQDNKTCIDIDECQIYGTCDQACVNNMGSYECKCITDFTLRADKKYCEVDDDEAMMLFSTQEEIRTIYLKSKKYFTSVRNISHATSVAKDENYIYWSNCANGSNYDTIMRINDNEEREVVVGTGLHKLSGLVIDWITHNIYFADDNERIGVCDNNGIHCTILIDEKPNHPKDIALLPSNGTMYWSSWGHHPHIAMSGMDGKNKWMIISQNLDFPFSVTLDYPNNRLYWADGNKIESSRLDGTDRRIILEDIVKYPVSLVIFENKLYWSDWERDTIQFCDKFSGKDWGILVEMSNIPHSLNIYHPAMQTKFRNPCHLKPCSELCLLNQDGKYTCACTLGKKLSADNSTCRETVKRQHFIIIAGNTFTDYYHELLGNPRTTVNHITQQINAVTCDSLSGTILASDQRTNHIIRYDPTTGDIENLFSIEAKTIGGMAFDHIGNNLYLSNIKDKTIEVYSLTTMAKTIFYFNETPYDIALIPEEGEMFVVHKKGHNKAGYYIDKLKLNGIGPRNVIRDNLVGPTISLHYNSITKELHWCDESVNALYTYTSQGIDFQPNFAMTKVASFASSGNFLFWTLYDSNLLYYLLLDTRQHFNPTTVAFHLPVTVKKPLVTPVYQIVTNEKYGCQNNNGNCSHVCLPSSNTLFICACPPDMMLSANNRTCVSQSACPPEEIKCSEHDICIRKDEWCDGILNCPNGEDEMDDCKDSGKCAKDQFACNNGNCISWIYHCNFHDDCGDDSDEDNCSHKCLSDEYQCLDETCISNALVCDGNFDCADLSDEIYINCTNHTCSPKEFKCTDGNCIPKEWECDGEIDCTDGNDETENCKSMKQCDEDHFECANNHRCISSFLKCNGINDCGDDSDERMCLDRADGHTGNCTKDEYHCFNTDTCLPGSVRCNGVQDCPKNDDEHHCAFCFEDEFTCDNQKCISQNWVCDKIDDCGDKSDERDCDHNKPRSVNNMRSTECPEFKCSTGVCLPFGKVCDGIRDCADSSDEGGKCVASCTTDNPCKSLCYKTPLGPVCGCRDGYRLGTDNISCDDVNECEYDGICSQICMNTLGSFKCSCFDGYVIRSDRISCKATGPPMEIITATDDDIRNITSDLKSFDIIYLLMGLGITSLDVNALDGSIYWSSGKVGFINKLNVKTKELSIIMDIGNPDVLAVDWVTSNVYFSNNGHPNVIKVCHIEQQKCAVVVNIEDTARVLVLVVDPGNRWLFWSQTTWHVKRTPSSEIYRTDMMGASMKKIVSRNVDLVNGMAIDYLHSRLYWSDTFRRTIESSNLDGTQRRTFLNADKHQPLGINIFENSLYWLMGASGVLQKCKMYGNQTCTTINIGASNVHEHFAIFQISRHPPMKNPCNDLNCDYMCVLSAKGATCICQDGKQITDNSTCTKDTSNQIAFTVKNVDRISRQSNGIYSIIIVALLIVALLLCAYYYYQRNKLKLKGDKSFESIRFYNPSYDRADEIAVTLNTIIPTSDISPGQHEYINPMNDPVNNQLLKDMEGNNAKTSGENLKNPERKY